MRYFKCENVLDEQSLSLTKEEKKIIRKEKTLNAIATIVFFLITIICCLCGIFTIMQIPIPQNIFLEIVWVVGIVILTLVTFLISLCIGGVASSPIWSKSNFDYYNSRRKFFSEACAYLQEYYEVQEPCLVTKCYDAGDKRFVNHDVCIFVVGDELRITTNLKHGFSRPEHDLGCYAFKAEEISLSEKQGEQYLMAELKVDNMVFLLGHRAKRFIEKNFLVSINECGKDGLDGML